MKNKSCSRRDFIKITGAAVAGLIPSIAAAESIFASKATSISLKKISLNSPNIIYILADDLGYGQVGCYGQTLVKTPRLDIMASEGMRFTQHYAGGPVCAPSRACLMTGKDQHDGYIKGNPVNQTDIPLRPEDLTITEILKAKGYDTACIGKWGLGPKGTTGYPLNKGFDYFCGYDTHNAAHVYWPTQLCKNNGYVTLGGTKYSHDFLTTEALNYLDQSRSNPFFLYLAFTIPHEPYDPPLKKADGTDDEFYALYKNKSWKAEYKYIAAMISRLDNSVGQILDKLKQKGIDKNTIVIFAGDNGPGSSYSLDHMAMVRFFDFNGPFIGMKRDVYDGGVRVPMIVRWPGKIQAATVSDHISAFQDILPTLAEIVGAQIPTGINSFSMLPTLLGENDRQLKHKFLYWELVQDRFGGRQSALMVNGNYKGVRYGSSGTLELYDLDTDIAEQNNIAALHPDKVAQIEAYMNGRSQSDLWPMPATGNKYPISGMQNWFIK